MQPKKTGKRGRPPTKKQSEDDQSNEEFSHKPTRKKVASKKNIDGQKKKLKLNRLTKSKLDLVSSLSDSDFMDEENTKKVCKVQIDVFNSDLVFAEILHKANKQPEFLINLKNLLSGCLRLREDKKSQYNKKWKQLRNSNSVQDEYLRRQSELTRMEAEQLSEIEDDIISKLALANIKGFETKDSIINTYKILHGNSDEYEDYVIDEQSWIKYREQQKKLLEILMKENDFVSQDYKLVNLTTKYSSNPISTDNANFKEQQNEMEMKFNNLDTEQNPQHTQFLFCKHYNNINYDSIFNSSSPFKIAEQEKYYIDSKAMSWLLESKCDEIYTNDQFQKQTYSRYSKMLKDMYLNPENYTDKEIMNNILETGAYVLNSFHYYQKFKLKCDLLHPLDLLLIIEKLSKNRTVKMGNESSELKVYDEHQMDIEENSKEKGNDSKMIDENEVEY